jgi:GT2 family glycosyltransferase
MATPGPGGPPPLVTFVVPCYRSRRTIGFTLRSILTQRTSASSEVLVVDSSEKPIADWIRTTFPTVRVLGGANRLYPGAARNRGAEGARGEFLAFLDADVVASPDWLEGLLAMVRDNPEAAAGGAVGNGNPQTASSRVQHWTEFSEFLPGSPPGSRPFLSTSNLLIGADVFRRTGGFPEELPMSEDLVFFHRFPGSALFESRVSVAHHHRSRWRNVLSHLKRLGYWGGYVRRDLDLRGGGLRSIPAASYLLPFYRTPVILRRVWRSGRQEGMRALVLSPLILAATAAWSLGFAAGLRGGDKEIGDRR